MASFATSLGLVHPVSPALAHAACLAFTSSYVGSLYLIPNARSRPHISDEDDGKPLDRQHPKVIKARMLGVALSSLLSVVGVGGLIWHGSARRLDVRGLIRATLRATGLALTCPFSALKAVVLPVLLTGTLFLGPLHTRCLDYGLRGLMPWYRGPSEADDDVRGWRGWRNFVIGPATEELVFRSCTLAAMALSGASKTSMIFLSPCWFGLAHLHHAWENYVTGGRTQDALKRSIFQSLFQFVYTTVFGWYASFIFLRTGSVYAATACHSFCNMMGLPPLAYALDRYRDRRRSIYSAYALGIAGFSCGLWRLTEPSLFGRSPVFWVSSS